MPMPLDRAVTGSFAAARAHRASSLILVALAFATSLVVFLTAGRSAAVEQDVLDRIDAAGTRMLTVQILEPLPGIDRAGLDRLRHATGVEWVMGLGPARDIRNAALPGGRNVAARALLTAPPETLRLEAGRSPHSGEAVVSEASRIALGLTYPSGALDDAGRILPVVGQYTVVGDISDLQRLVLTGADPDTDERATLVYILADHVINVPVVAAQIPVLAGVEGADGISITTSDDLITVQQAVGGELSRFGRSMAAGALGAGLVLMALTISLALSARRRDHGRRRALGASRSATIVLAVLEVLHPITVGAVLGSLTGALAVYRITGNLPGTEFTVAVPALNSIIGILAAVVPATVSSLRDPVRILRVP